MGRVKESYAFERELVNMHRKLYEIEPDAHRETFGSALLSYVDWLVFADRVPEACDAFLEVVELHRELFESNRYGHHERFTGLLDRYFSLLTDSGEIRAAADVAKEILSTYHDLWKEDRSVYFNQVRNVVAKYDGALNAAGYKYKAPNILVSVHRARYQVAPGMKNARELTESLATYANRLDEAGRLQDASDAASELVGILQKHPLPPRSAEAMGRTEQLHSCSFHAVKAQDYEQALNIAELAMQSAQDVDETDESSAWVQRWRPKTMRHYGDIKQLVRRQKHTADSLKLRLTYRDNTQVGENSSLPR